MTDAKRMRDLELYKMHYITTVIPKTQITQFLMIF